MGFPNPIAASGTDEEMLMAFRKGRDQIRKEMVAFNQRRNAGAMTPRDDELPLAESAKL